MVVLDCSKTDLTGLFGRGHFHRQHPVRVACLGSTLSLVDCSNVPVRFCFWKCSLNRQAGQEAEEKEVTHCSNRMLGSRVEDNRSFDDSVISLVAVRLAALDFERHLLGMVVAQVPVNLHGEHTTV